MLSTVTRSSASTANLRRIESPRAPVRCILTPFRKIRVIVAATSIYIDPVVVAVAWRDNAATFGFALDSTQIRGDWGKALPGRDCIWSEIGCALAQRLTLRGDGHQ